MSRIVRAMIKERFITIITAMVVVWTLFAVSSGVYAATITYTYDNLHRLTMTDYGNGTVIEYTYDAAGNRLNQRIYHNTPSLNSFTPAGSNVTVSPVNGTTLTFSEILSSGDTTITTSATGPHPPGGFRVGNPPAYYDITNLTHVMKAFLKPILTSVEVSTVVNKIIDYETGAKGDWRYRVVFGLLSIRCLDIMICRDDGVV